MPSRTRTAANGKSISNVKQKKKMLREIDRLQSDLNPKSFGILNESKSKRRHRSLSNNKESDESDSSNNSLLNIKLENDGLITKTLYVFTPPKDVKKSNEVPITITKKELVPVIDKLLKKNHDKLGHIKNEIISPPTNGLSLNNNFSNENSKDINFIKIKLEDKSPTLKGKLNKSISKETPKKLMRVVIEKSGHIDDLVKISNYTNPDNSVSKYNITKKIERPSIVFNNILYKRKGKKKKKLFQDNEMIIENSNHQYNVLVEKNSVIDLFPHNTSSAASFSKDDVINTEIDNISPENSNINISCVDNSSKDDVINIEVNNISAENTNYVISSEDNFSKEGVINIEVDNISPENSNHNTSSADNFSKDGDINIEVDNIPAENSNHNTSFAKNISEDDAINTEIDNISIENSNHNTSSGDNFSKDGVINIEVDNISSENSNHNTSTGDNFSKDNIINSGVDNIISTDESKEILVENKSTNIENINFNESLVQKQMNNSNLFNPLKNEDKVLKEQTNKENPIILNYVRNNSSLLFETDLNAQLFQSVKINPKDYFAKYDFNELKYCNYCMHKAQNFEWDKLDIIQKHNFELQTYIYGFLFKTILIEDLIVYLTRFTKKINSGVNSNDYGRLVNEQNLKPLNSKKKLFNLEINNTSIERDYKSEKDLLFKNDEIDHIEKQNYGALENNLEKQNYLKTDLTKKKKIDTKFNEFSKILDEKYKISLLQSESIQNKSESKQLPKLMNSTTNNEFENRRNSAHSSNTDYNGEEQEILSNFSEDHVNQKITSESVIAKNNFQLDAGNIYWGRIYSFPYWPCIISPDSENNIIKKFHRENDIRVHVRFFADNGRVSWIPKINLMPYYGEKEFLEKANKFGSLNKKPKLNPYLLSSHQKVTWLQGCREADNLMLEPIEKRLDKFQVMLEDSIKSLRLIRKKKQLNNSTSSSMSNFISGKRRRSAIETPHLVETSDDISRTDPKLENINYKDFCNEIKYLTGLSAGDDDSEISMYISGLWKHRQSNLSKRGSIRIKTLANNRVIDTLEQKIKQNEKLEQDAVEVKKVKPNKPKSIPIEETLEDILKLSKNHLFQNMKKEIVCQICLTIYDEHNTIKCATNDCPNWFHVKCASDKDNNSLYSDENKNLQNNNIIEHISEIEITSNNILLCKSCTNIVPVQCFVCKESVSVDHQTEDTTKIEDNINNQLIKCRLTHCAKYFHQDCLKYWPQARFVKSENKLELTCPSHVCQTCISDDPKITYIKCLKLIKCVECPSSYHVDSNCIPAGTVFLTKTDIICPRHEKFRRPVANTNWCFMCSVLGGTLICCETCPSSFHAECLKLLKVPDKYICEQCESGRMPLYGEMVWAKHGSHRYWPGIIIPPIYVPLPVQKIKHEQFSFCVRFLGTHDHSWLNRQRVYLYQDDDWRYVPNNTKSNKLLFLAIKESHTISEFLKAKKLELNIRDKELQFTPQPYTKIIYNRPVPPVKLQEVTDLNACNCNPNDENPCGLYSECINRICYTECHPKLCSSGIKCENQMFEKRQYAPVKVLKTKNKGFGLFSQDFIVRGSFIIEYVGELINEAELKSRIAMKMQQKDEIFYFLHLSNNITIDAGPKGNLARFMNHSCDPNCEAQTWIVNGNLRIGLFAIDDIAPNTELNFHYNLEGYGDSQIHCLCSAENCTGFITKKKEKKLVKNLSKA